MKSILAPFQLNETYAQLLPNGDSKVWDAKTFWEGVQSGEIGDSDFGHLVATFDYDSDWPSWEMHPAGDELVCVLKGEFELVLEFKDGEKKLRLKEGETAIVPKGVWHRALVQSPARALHFTPGEGTIHRPL